MTIERVTLKNDIYILSIKNKDYIVDEYVYKSILPYTGKQIDQKQLELIVAFSIAFDILKPLYKKIFQNKISKKMVYLKLTEKLEDYYAHIIISTFKEDNYLDDKVFAKNLISKYQSNKGKKEIENLLIKERLSNQIISELLSSFEENEEYVYNFIKQKYCQNNTSNKLFIYKIKQQLLNKGFSEKLINKVINDFKFSNDDKYLIKDLQKLQKKYDNKQKIISKLINKGYNVEDIKNAIRKGDLDE